MKNLKFLILTLFFLSLCITFYSQVTYTWVGGNGSSFTTSANWSPAGLPVNSNDTIVFSNGAAVLITDIPSNINLGGMKILNSTAVTFESAQSVFANIFDIYIDVNSTLNILQSLFPIQISTDHAFISGGVFLDNAAHTFMSMSSVSQLVFDSTSIFSAGINLTGFPLGNMNPNTVTFKNGAIYYHYGGGSPFGSPDWNVTTFETESYYYIKEDVSGDIYCSGKTYGHIIVDTPADIIVLSTGTGTFTFNSLSVVNGTFTFEGTENESVDITGGINVNAGQIDLDCGSFRFINSGYINGTSGVVNFDIKNLAGGSNFEILSVGNILDIQAIVNIISVNGQINTINVNGTVNVTSGEFNFFDQSLVVGGDILCESGVLGSGATSSLYLTSGTGTQMILAFNELGNKNILSVFSVNRPGLSVDVISNLIINDGLDLANGNILVSGKNIRLASGITTSGGSASSYIITAIGGNVTSNLIGGTSFIFPVGTFDKYAPVAILAAANDLFTVDVREPVLSSGYYGDTLTYGNLVYLTWEIISNLNTTYNLDLDWDLSAEGGQYNFANANLNLYNEVNFEWENTTSTTTPTAAGNISAANLNISGLYMVSSGNNSLPTGGAVDKVTDLGVDVSFAQSDFVFNDADNDQFTKLLITQNITGGSLYIDNDGTNSMTTGEEIFAGHEILVSDIAAGKFRYAPSSEGTFTGGFKVSDGINYSTSDYGLNIIVGVNYAPIVYDQEFTIPEHSPNGTVVGQLEATVSDASQTLLFEVAINDNGDAFNISSDGVVTVSNTQLLEYSVNPVFKYLIKVYSSTSADLFSEFNLFINLTEVPAGDLLVTNYISPNGDGVNDTWVVKGNDATRYRVSIFDKHGNVVFVSDDYRSEWNGRRYNGERLNPGVYYYSIISEGAERKGTITLMR
ncbi:MAG: gliding motility-associated C-terminal domain-containing protein [Bacteroidales bacterium]|nr:gliding motility-associated C-terminal domain-containing protein [Bacteroidales bacterium]